MFQQFYGIHLEPVRSVVGVIVCPRFFCLFVKNDVEKDISGNNSIIVGRIWLFLET
jgi:hypothetical protein